MFSPRYLIYRPFILVFLISCFLLSGFTYTLYKQAQDNDRANAIAFHTYEVIRYAGLVILNAGDIETGQRGYLLTRSAEFLEPYKQGLKTIDHVLADLRKEISQNPQQLERFSDINEKINTWKKELAAQIERFQSPAQTAISVGDLRYAKMMMDDVRTSLEAFVEIEKHDLSKRLEYSRGEQRRYFLTLFVGATFAMMALLIANLIIIKSLEKAKTAETKLHDFEETYRLLLENLNDGVYDFKPQLGKLGHSESYARMLGYKPEELSDDIESIKALIHPDDAEQVWEVYDRYKQGKIPYYTNTFRMRHSDGSFHWILSRGVGNWDEHGNMVRLLGIHTDITEQKRREEELRQLNADLEGFIYIVSHDLRSPLVNLKGFAGEVNLAIQEIMPALAPCLSALQEADAKKVSQLLNEDIPESLGFIRSGVDRMDTLTSAILDLSRVGRREYRIENVSAQTIVKRCIDSLNYDISRNNIEIKTDSLPDVETDAIALEQIFGNIIENAVKYLDPSRRGSIHIQAQQFPWETIFSIKDNGRGISGTDYPKIFDIFRRASNVGEVRGAGMGMAFVKAVIRKLGGRIWFDSVMDQGTTFYFSIPSRNAQTNLSLAS